MSLQDDLAKPTGSSLVGYTQDSASAVSRTIQDKERETVSVKDFGAKGDGVNDDTAKLQSAIDYAAATGAKIFFPLGKYIISTALLVYGQNEFPIYLYGESDGSSIITSSTVANDTIIKIKGNNKYKNDNPIKIFSNLSFVAINADGQSCFKYEYYKTDEWGKPASFRIKNCSMNSKGYNVDYSDCQWAGASYIKECNCWGGGLIKTKVDPTKYRGDHLYPHAFSNLVIEDVHFSATGGWPKDSLMYLEGCQNSYFKNITLEGSAKYFDPTADFEMLCRGSYLHVSGGSITFDTLWTEFGGTNNIPNAFDFSFEGVGISTAPASVVFENCHHLPLKMKGSQREKSTFIKVTVNHSSFLDPLTLKFDEGSFITLVDCTFRNNDINTLLLNDRVKIQNPSFALYNSNSTIGAGVCFGDSHKNAKNKIIYEWTGGHLSNDFLPTKLLSTYQNLNNHHFPHHSPKSGYSFKCRIKDRTFFLWEAVNTTDFSTLDITFPVTISYAMRARLHHHKTNRGKQEFRTFVVQHEFATMEIFCNVIFRDLFNIIGNNIFVDYNIVEFTNLQFAIGENFPFHRIGNVNCHDTSGLDHLHGTWIKNDVVKMRDKTTAFAHVCTTGGTSDPLLTSNSGEVRTGELKKVYISDFSKFKEFIGGEFITVGGIPCRVIDYFYGTTDADNYLQVDKDLAVGTGLAIAGSMSTWRTF